uniref:DNA 3'-5' helicase n=1 Tax=Corethron hystrix TaxID=216773 RepID=A0A7S1BNE0_9STRA|mmetsp:Transcript_34984/g.80916  ORF Transcript_34984/g.80916 Transcript_34984/m.80916 type:complete len:528 (+) Transcript_34984:245-1828(+)
MDRDLPGGSGAKNKCQEQTMVSSDTSPHKKIKLKDADQSDMSALPSGASKTSINSSCPHPSLMYPPTRSERESKWKEEKHPCKIGTSSQTISPSDQQATDDKEFRSKYSVPTLQVSKIPNRNYRSRATNAKITWNQVQTTLRNIFGHSSLHPLQREAISSVLSLDPQYANCKQTLLLLATGGGKSLVYQLPALLLPGITVVVSPLVSLMVDQSERLKTLLRNTEFDVSVLSSASDAAANRKVVDRILSMAKKPPSSSSSKSSAGASDIRYHCASSSSSRLKKIVKILYCTPELISTEKFRNVLRALHFRNYLSLFAFDEAHCVSSWGHDFRPAYRRLGWLRSEFEDVSVVACTATATGSVIRDIGETLEFEKKTCAMHVGSFNRHNIFYEVRHKHLLDSSYGGAIADLISFIRSQHRQCEVKNEPCTGVVYVFRRQDTSDLAQKISRACDDANIIALPYHAGLKDDLRTETQKRWTSGNVNVVVATIAFGMGIDLPHVRYVIHWNLAKSVEVCGFNILLLCQLTTNF